MASRYGPPAARSWNPNFKHTDRERWICIYPAYLNSNRTIAQGRVIPKDKAVCDPTFAEIKEVCSSTGLILGVENKIYPREIDPRDLKVIGRIRVQLRDESGKPVLARFPTRKSLIRYCGEMIPKLKSRLNSNQSQSLQQPAQPQSSKSTKKKKGKR